MDQAPRSLRNILTSKDVLRGRQQGRRRVGEAFDLFRGYMGSKKLCDDAHSHQASSPHEVLVPASLVFTALQKMDNCEDSCDKLLFMLYWMCRSDQAFTAELSMSTPSESREWLISSSDRLGSLACIVCKQKHGKASLLERAIGLTEVLLAHIVSMAHDVKRIHHMPQLFEMFWQSRLMSKTVDGVLKHPLDIHVAGNMVECMHHCLDVVKTMPQLSPDIAMFFKDHNVPTLLKDIHRRFSQATNPKKDILLHNLVVMQDGCIELFQVADAQQSSIRQGRRDNGRSLHSDYIVNAHVVTSLPTKVLERDQTLCFRVDNIVDHRQTCAFRKIQDAPSMSTFTRSSAQAFLQAVSCFDGAVERVIVAYGPRIMLVTISDAKEIIENDIHEPNDMLWLTSWTYISTASIHLKALRVLLRHFPAFCFLDSGLGAISEAISNSTKDSEVVKLVSRLAEMAEMQKYSPVATKVASDIKSSMQWQRDKERVDRILHRLRVAIDSTASLSFRREDLKAGLDAAWQLHSEMLLCDRFDMVNALELMARESQHILENMVAKVPLPEVGRDAHARGSKISLQQVLDEDALHRVCTPAGSATVAMAVEGMASPLPSKREKQRLARAKARQHKLDELARQKETAESVERLRLYRNYPRLTEVHEHLPSPRGEIICLEGEEVVVLQPSPIPSPPTTRVTRARSQRRRILLQEFWRLPANAPHAQEHALAMQEDIDALKVGATHAVDPFALHFCHASISSSFRTGLRLDDAIDAVLGGDALLDALPPVEAVKHKGKLFVFAGNRRLYVYRVAAALGAACTIQMHLLPWSCSRVQGMRWDAWLGRMASKWESAFSTVNGGAWVAVRSKYSRWQLADNDDEVRSGWLRTMNRQSASLSPCRGHVARMAYHTQRRGQSVDATSHQIS